MLDFIHFSYITEAWAALPLDKVYFYAALLMGLVFVSGLVGVVLSRLYRWVVGQSLLSAVLIAVPTLGLVYLTMFNWVDSMLSLAELMSFVALSYVVTYSYYSLKRKLDMIYTEASSEQTSRFKYAKRCFKSAFFYLANPLCLLFFVQAVFLYAPKKAKLSSKGNTWHLLHPNDYSLSHNYDYKFPEHPHHVSPHTFW